MTNHEPLSKPISFFGRFEPKETYIWLDGPRTFSLLDEEAQLCFAHWLQELGDNWQYVVVPVNGAIEKTEVSGTAFKVVKPVQLTRQDRKLVTWQQKKIASTGIPRKFDQIGTIVDILGDDTEIHVDFRLDDTLERRSCKFNEDLWEFYGEKFHVNKVIRVFGVAVSSKDPVTVLQVAFVGEDGNQLEEAT